MPNLGVLALVVAAGGLLTGPFLALNYAPTLDAAHDSVAYIENGVTLGWLLRGLHHWSANFAIVLAALHGARLFLRRAYRKPRQMAWVAGCGVFLVLVGFAYTGYLLAGDERAYTGLAVMERVAGSTPLVGEQASALIKGGPTVSSATLTRLYVVHTMLLPALLVALVAAYVVALRRTPASGPARPWAELLVRDARAAVAVCLLLAVAAVLFRPGLGPKLDPGGAGAPDARPEWFLLWVNQLLRMVPGATFLVAALLPGLIVAFAFGLPWIARGESRTVERATAGAIVLLIGVLTVVGVATAPPAAGAADADEPDRPAAASDEKLEEKALRIIRRKCASCHTVDGDEEGGDTAPPLNRDGFAELYTERFFRAKVTNPSALWRETGMVYANRRKTPTKEDLEILVRFFFGKQR